MKILINPIKKRGTELKREFSAEEVQMVKNSFIGLLHLMKAFCLFLFSILQQKTKDSGKKKMVGSFLVYAKTPV